MPFPTGFIEELKARNPIDKVISRYVELKRAGSNLVGLCPFHSERTPSFTVFRDNYHCFGCSAGGDVITFVMRMENLEYPDAVRFLADSSGMQMPVETSLERHSKAVLTREKSFQMNKIAARLFYENLNSSAGQAAREYLMSRKLSKSTCVHFGIGYALPSFNNLTDKLLSEGFTVNEIKENFLCGISSKNGKPFDMFRNRIMFPIIDTTGNVVAFGGRVMDDSKPKYLNSSDTVVFKKSRNLFALNFAKNSILGNDADVSENQKSYVRPGELIMCEGYLDVIAMHQAGFTNAVATLGTAITSEHARIIARYAKTAYLAYDSDSAGKTATSRAINMLTEAGVDAKIIKIDGAKDPDEYIKKYGSAAFAKIITASQGQIDYKINTVIEKYNLSDTDEKLKAIREVCRVIAAIPSKVEKELYTSRCAEKMQISLDSIKAEVKHAVKSESRRVRSAFRDQNMQTMMNYNDRINPQSASNIPAVTAEKRILGILLMYPELIGKAELKSDDFVTDFNRGVFEHMVQLFEQGAFDVSALNEFYSPEEYSYILNMQFSRQALSSNGEDALAEQISSLRKIKNNGKLKDDESFSDVIQRIRDQKLKGC